MTEEYNEEKLFCKALEEKDCGQLHSYGYDHNIQMIDICDRTHMIVTLPDAKYRVKFDSRREDDDNINTFRIPYSKIGCHILLVGSDIVKIKK